MSIEKKRLHDPSGVESYNCPRIDFSKSILSWRNHIYRNPLSIMHCWISR